MERKLWTVTLFLAPNSQLPPFQVWLKRQGTLESEKCNSTPIKSSTSYPPVEGSKNAYVSGGPRTSTSFPLVSGKPGPLIPPASKRCLRKTIHISWMTGTVNCFCTNIHLISTSVCYNWLIHFYFL